MKKIGKFLLMVVITLLSFGVNAQETTSEIQGLVSDGKSGLSGVTIVATHQPTGTKYITSTRNDGRYNLPNLKIGGPYSKQNIKMKLRCYWVSHTKQTLV
jgi:hypothetical protein